MLIFTFLIQMAINFKYTGKMRLGSFSRLQGNNNKTFRALTNEGFTPFFVELLDKRSS